MADMDGQPFDQAKPPKNMEERMESAKASLSNAGSFVATNAATGFAAAKVHGGAAATKVGEQASILKARIQEK